MSTKEAVRTRPAAEEPAAPPPAAPAPPPAAEAAAAPPDGPKARELKPLVVTAFTLIQDSGGSFGRVWGATIPEGTPWEHVLHDSFWAHKANIMLPWDKILVRHAAREYYAELLVLETRTVGNAVEKNRVTVHVLERHDLKPAEAEIADYLAMFSIDNLGPQKKWCVINVADRTIVHEGFDNMVAAQRGRLYAAQVAKQREGRR